jgi:CHAT domain-containing protein
LHFKFELALQKEQPELAIIFYKQSVNIYETLRNDIKGLDSNIQKTYLSTIEGTYRRLADLLLQQNRILESQRVLDLIKVQELDDLFDNAQVRSSDSELGIFHRSSETAFLDRYNAKLREEIALGKEYIALQTRNNTGLSPTEEKRFLELQARQTSDKNSLTAFLNDPSIQAILEKLKDYIGGDNQAFETEQISQLRNKFKAIQNQGKNAALLYPLILDDRLELVLTTSLTTSIRRTVDISRTDLNKLLLAAGQTLKNPSDANYQALEELYEVLITPIEAALDEANIETLIYAPDGALRYLPLAALRNPTTGQWLIDKYQVNNVTALSLTNFGQDSPQNLNVLAGAFVNGNYDFKVTVSDGQITAERPFSFAGLTYAGEEVTAIANLTRARTYIDKDFGEDVTKRFNLYNVIHFATHAQFIPDAPKDSFLVFGNGEYATLRDIEADWGELTNNQLVVLSACETALGTDFTELRKENSGIEILGLGYQLQNKGARAIMASLWQVKDKSTQVLMTEFYQGLSSGESTVEALRQAQATLSQSEEYAHPHHWASFVVIGNGL